MNFANAVTRNLAISGGYADFSGRASRSEYWWFYLFCVLAVSGTTLANQFLGSLASIFLVIPSLAVLVRRLHDIGKSGWYLLVGLIPLIGFFVVLFWLVQPSEKANAYGKGPAKA